MTKITHHNCAGKPTACSQTAQNDLTAEALSMTRWRSWQQPVDLSVSPRDLKA